jgi:hypothetical protein
VKRSKIRVKHMGGVVVDNVDGENNLSKKILPLLSTPEFPSL